MKRIVLIGLQGHGKTTLYNKITSSNEKTKFGGKAVTQNIILKSSSFGKGFDVLDTPGFGVITGKFQHTACIVAALIEGPVNKVCIVVKNERTDIMYKQVMDILTCCQSFKDIVVVAITYWDMSENPQEDEIIIRELLKKYFNLPTVVFISKNNNGKDICNKFDAILKESQQRTLTFSFSNIYLQFDAIELKNDDEQKIKQQRNEISRQFSQICDLYYRFINNFKSKDGNIIDIMHSLTLNIKDEAERLIKEFQIKCCKITNKLVDVNGNNIQYLYSVILKQEIWQEMQQVMEKAQMKMKDYGSHCYNFLKACPHCHLIWLKVDGCDGKVTCGQLPKNTKDKMLQQETAPRKISFKIVDNNLTWIYQNYPEQQKNQQQQFTIANNKDGGFFDTWFGSKSEKRNLKGCGKTIIWKTAPSLEESILKELVTQDVFDFFAKNQNFEMKESELQAEPFENQFNLAFSNEVLTFLNNIKKN